MAKTFSNMLPLGTPAFDFELMDVSTEQYYSLMDLKSSTATVIMFICNHCPFVKLIQDKLVEIALYYQDRGVRFTAISSNDVTAYPDDHPEKMKVEARIHNYPFPYLYDEDQSVAKAYRAACTPDFYVFDKNLLCVYRGRFDDATPGNKKLVTGRDLCKALDCLINNEPIDQNQQPSLGCNIKWKK